MRGLWGVLFALLFAGHIMANGVVIIDATNAVNFELVSSSVTVTVENQIAVVTSQQVFRNDFGSPTPGKYGFPLSDAASATDLRWQVGGQWFQADIRGTAQDTTLPGSGTTIAQEIVDYMGETPLYFNIPQVVQPDSELVVQVTYVEFLPYSFGNVDFSYANDYTGLQSGNLESQTLQFELVSERNINTLVSNSTHTVTQLSNDGNLAVLSVERLDSPADEDYSVQYSLDLSQLGLFSLSTTPNDTLIPDSLGGYFAFVVEPDPTETDVIEKVFTLIIDRSGSMSGNKIVQARDAAEFIVNNLNDADRFNIVDFSSSVSNFSNEHVPWTVANRDDALNYIAGLNALGGTNISGAFDRAIPQFATANDSTANIIVFFTDGQATSGITNTQLLSNHVDDLVSTSESNVSIFTFGIGAGANEQLLTLLASNNNGLAEFLGDDELFSRITSFYQRIRNPVLLNTQIAFSPSVISEVYPDPLPNLYIGQQMIVTGRFTEAVPITVDLTGDAFGLPVAFNYSVELSDTSVSGNEFLPKVWAKSKIENLLVDYYSFDPASQQAKDLKDQIIQISTDYGVISPFTRFSGGTPVGIEDEEELDQPGIAGDFELLGNYPNPFNPTTTIRLKVHRQMVGEISIKIYNALGQIVRILTVTVNGAGQYEVQWDGLLTNGEVAASGLYIYTVELGNTVLAGKMTLMK